MKKFTKFINNPLFYISNFLVSFFHITLFPLRFFFYKNLGWNSKIAISSTIKNRKNIKIGYKVEIGPFVVLWPTKLIISDCVQINPGTAIYGNVSIGNSVMIAPNCMIAGGNHGVAKSNVPMRFQPSVSKGIIIEDDVWIGANSVITDGVTLRKGTIVAAGSVVTKSTEEYSINAGVPSKKINERK